MFWNAEFKNLRLIIPKSLQKNGKNRTLLENKLKELQDNLNAEDNIQSYVIYKKELGHIAEGIRIWSKCHWYEHDKKSTKFYLILEKKHGNQNQIRKLLFDDKEIDGDVEIIKSSKVSMKHFSKVSLSKKKAKLKNSYVLSLLRLLTTIK